jgi:hypothetical protein
MLYQHSAKYYKRWMFLLYLVWAKLISLRIFYVNYAQYSVTSQTKSIAIKTAHHECTVNVLKIPLVFYKQN